MIKYQELQIDTVLNVAKKMAIAAKTAPKGRGKDCLEIMIAHGNDLQIIADKMENIGKTKNQDFFIRDAISIRNSVALLFLGTRIEPLGLAYCGLCGMNNCGNKEKHPEIPCMFNTNDLGIAIGSAVSVAMNNRVDNRVMYSVGMAARELKLFHEDVKIILGIGLSATGKNIFFDRK
jgi:uncharacterized ferredoxin-like protein